MAVDVPVRAHEDAVHRLVEAVALGRVDLKVNVARELLGPPGQ